MIANPAAYQLNVNRGTITKLDAFRALISSFIEKKQDTDAYSLGQELIKVSGISADLFSETDPESLARQENLEEFLSGIQDFVESRREEGQENQIYLTDFLQEVSLLTDLDSDTDEQSRVTLMTVHSAKGLEFPTVFIVGLEENIFPSPLSTNSVRELEEERRLLLCCHYACREALHSDMRQERFSFLVRWSSTHRAVLSRTSIPLCCVLRARPTTMITLPAPMYAAPTIARLVSRMMTSELVVTIQLSAHRLMMSPIMAVGCRTADP